MSCTPLPLASDAELQNPEAIVGQRAFLAKDAARMALTKSGTERHNLAVELFPYVVDKDNWPTPPHSGLPARTQVVQRNELLIIEGRTAYLRVGTLVPPFVCLAIVPITPAQFELLLAEMRKESSSRGRLQILKANQRNYMFSEAQVKRLAELLRYREEQSELETLLRRYH